MGFFSKLFKGDWSNPFDNVASGVKNVAESAWNDTISNGPGRLAGLAALGGSMYLGGSAMGWGDAFKTLGPMALDYYQTDQANTASAREAELNRQFQERLSSTSYQRVMADMAAAGLNPMLAYGQGGASTPGGAQAPVLKGQGGDLLSTGIQAASVRKLQDAQTDQAKAAARAADSESIYKGALTGKIPEEIKILLNQQRKIVAETGVADAQSALFDAQRENRVKELQIQAAQIVKLVHEGKSAQAQAAYDVWRTKGMMVLAPSMDEGIGVLSKWLHGLVKGGIDSARKYSPGREASPGVGVPIPQSHHDFYRSGGN